MHIVWATSYGPWGLASALIWLVWVGYWLIASQGVKPALRRESLASRLGHFVPLGIATWLIAAPHLPGRVLEQRWRPVTDGLLPLGIAVQIGGLLFSVWARRTLGRNWSASVTVKSEHRLIRSGPYRQLRHPIYTGILFGYVGCALLLGEWRGLLAVALVAGALWRKLRLEERWMTETFGDRYREYQAGTRALIPWLI